MPRPVTIVADDYGIGPETSRGILDLCLEGRVTAAVLIVNTPHAEQAARQWLAADPPADLGWHPNITLDQPLLPPEQVASLVRPDGTFWPLRSFLRRVLLRRIRATEVLAEWRAQYRRFNDLVGRPPKLVNSHQHVSLFPPCDSALLDTLQAERSRPYLRRVIESVPVVARVPGARFKRAALSLLGRRAARRASKRGHPGCDQLAGVTDAARVADDRFWQRWIDNLGNTGSVELCCHPGYRDETLIGRDCDAGDGLLRRPREIDLLRSPLFRSALERAELEPVRPSMLPPPATGGR